VIRDRALSRRQFPGAAAGAALTMGAGPPTAWLSGQTPRGAGAGGGLAQPEQTLVLVNGRIHTMSAGNTIVSTVSIRNGRFVSVGVDSFGNRVNGDQQITRQEALGLFTRGNSWFLRMEDKIGSTPTRNLPTGRTGGWSILAAVPERVRERLERQHLHPRSTREKRLQKFVYKGLGPVSKQDQGVVWPRATAH
jgi:hypothetical protein